MNIQVDTREHKEEWKRVQKQFDAIEGVSYFRSKLYVGDYQSLDNPRLVIDRKKDLQEICGNVRQQHERFKKELLKAMDAGIQIVILIEHGSDIQCLEDVIFFNQPETTRWRWKTVEVDGKKKKIREKYQQKAINGNTLYRSLCTIRDRYNVRFEFCEKKDTGKKIIQILSEGR